MSSNGGGYAESVGSCGPHLSPAAAAAWDASRRRAAEPVRRQLDFADGGGGELDEEEEDDDFLFRAAEEVERGLREAKRLRAVEMERPECVCRRGVCVVEPRDGGGWVYVCPATPKCRYEVWCAGADLAPSPQTAVTSYPKPCNQFQYVPNIPSNPHVFGSPTNPNAFGSPSNHRPAMTPNSQPALWSHPKPSNPHVFNGQRNPHVSNGPSNHRAGARIPINVSPQGAISNDKQPFCQCGAGVCQKVTFQGQEYYVCHIPKGYGACSHRVLANAAVEESPQTGINYPMEDEHVPIKVERSNENGPINLDKPEDEWPFDIIDGDVVCSGNLVNDQPTTNTPRQQIAMIELQTPTKSPMPPYGSRSPITPGSTYCFRCGEEGHWAKNCPSPASSPQNSQCYSCGKLGHWSTHCPK